MTANGWLQILAYVVAVLALTKPLGAYMFRVFETDRRPLPRVLGAVERVIYRCGGVDPSVEHSWRAYAGAVLPPRMPRLVGRRDGDTLDPP